MQNKFFTFVGTLLTLALVVFGQILLHPSFRPDLLSANLTLPVAAGATLLAMVMAAVVLPRRSDTPGLQPHPRVVEPLPLPPSVPVGAPTVTTVAVGRVTTLPRLSFALALRVLLVIASLALAYAAQFIFLGEIFQQLTEPRVLALGSGLLVLGMVIYGTLAMRMDAGYAPLEYPTHITVPLAPDLTRPWHLAWLAVSLGCYAFAMGRYEGGGENSAVVIAWLVGIAALLIAQWNPRQPRRWRIAPQERVYLAVLAVILVIALAMRVYRLTTLPYDLDGDFASVGLEARAILAGQRRLFSLGWANIPVLGYMPPALTMLVFGTGQVGLNMSGVIEGLLIIVGVYLLGRELFSPRVALIAAALLTVLYNHLHFSRTSVYIDPIFFMVFAMYFLLRGLRYGKGWTLALSGVLSAFALQMYYSGRALFFIVAVVFAYLLIARRRWFLARWQGIFLWVLSVIVATGPYLIVILRNRDGFVERSRSVFLLYEPVVAHMYNKYHVDTIPALLWEQAKHTLLMFHYYIDTSTQFGFTHPYLDPLTAPLFALGVGYALFRLRRFGFTLLLAWLGLVLIIGCYMTSNAPFWPRLVGLLPPVALLTAIAIDRLYEPLARLLAERVHPRAHLALSAVLAAGIVFVGVVNWGWYVEQKGDWGTARTRIGRYVASQDPTARAYMVYDPFSYNDREIEFLVPGRFLGDITEEQARNGEFALANGPTLIIVTPNHLPLLDALRGRFPEGSVVNYPGNSPGEIAFHAFVIPPRP